MENINFPEIYRNRIIDTRLLRFYAVYMTACSEGGINIALAKSIERFVMKDEQTISYEKKQVDEIITKNL